MPIFTHAVCNIEAAVIAANQHPPPLHVQVVDPWAGRSLHLLVGGAAWVGRVLRCRPTVVGHLQWEDAPSVQGAVPAYLPAWALYLPAWAPAQYISVEELKVQAIRRGPPWRRRIHIHL